MYSVIDYLTNPADPDQTGPFLEIHEGEVRVPGALSWQTGAKFADPLPTPIQIRATPRHGYQGPPHDFYDGNVAFMSKRMADVLRSAAVDNLDLYPSVITYTDSGEQHDVLAFNLLGLVSAADHAASNLSSSDGDYLMDTGIAGLQIDSKKARDFYLFRLAENCSTVIVHDKVRRAIEAANINTFAFVDPPDWFRLG
jgi:hypothetical protein